MPAFGGKDIMKPEINGGGQMKKKCLKTVQYVVQYVKSHISVQVTLTVMLLLISAVMVFHSYVKNTYFQFMLEDTRDTVQTIANVSAENLNGKLKEVLNTSCTIAIDDELLKSVNDARFSGLGDVRSKMSIEAQLSTIIQYAGSIAVAAIVTDEGILKEYARYWSDRSIWQMWNRENQLVLEQLYTEVMDKLKENTVMRYSVSTDAAYHEKMENVPLFHIAVPLLGKRNRLEELDSMLVLTFRLDKIYDMGELVVKNGRKDVTRAYLADKDGKILCHENPEFLGWKVEDYQKQTGKWEDVSRELEYFGWTLYVSIDVEEMRTEVDRLYQNSIYVYIMLLLGCALLWQLVFQKILRPLVDIRNAMKNIQLEHEMAQVEVKGSHEIWQLAENYNKMTEELKAQREEIGRQYKEKTLSIELRNKAEREALESQINAHFLCNTLTAINYDAVENEDYEVASHLKKLSAILSYVFSKKQIHVTLGQEMQWVEQYLYLQKFRLMDVFDYVIDFPEEYGEWPCCKLFLQPFVENSILHGFEGMEQGGLIKIEGKLVEKRFRLIIADNGCGMDKETEAELQNIISTSHTLELAGDGIGIRNVVTRLRMFYGKEMDIRLETSPKQGTSFTFWLPLLTEQVDREEE